MNVEAHGDCIGLLTSMQRILLNFSLLDGLFVAINRLQENFKMTLYDLLLSESEDSMNGAQL